MPRQARFVMPEVAVHIVQRGHDRRDCFRQESDYLVYLSNLGDLAAKRGCAVHAYCLMTNHVHLLLTPSSARSCALLMRDLGQRYVQHFNRRYGRTGTLWEGRYLSFLAETARYVLACYRYIELNPVDAGMVSDPASYPWSSYGANTGTRADPLIEAHSEFLALGSDAARRHASYARLVADGVEPSLLREIREAEDSGYPLASAAFKADLAVRAGLKTEPGRPGRPGKKAREEPPGLGEIGL